MANPISRLARGRRVAQRRRRDGGCVPAPARWGVAPRLAVVLGAFGMGALADRFVFDRANARRRRHLARERGVAKLRRRSRAAVRRAKYTEGVAEGVAHRAAHAVPGVGKRKEPLDDVSLAQKVEGEAFRRAGVSKAHVSINAERGVVYLRGRLDSEREIEALVRAAGAVEASSASRTSSTHPRRRRASKGADARWPNPSASSRVGTTAAHAGGRHLLARRERRQSPRRATRIRHHRLRRAVPRDPDPAPAWWADDPRLFRRGRWVWQARGPAAPARARAARQLRRCSALAVGRSAPAGS